MHSVIMPDKEQVFKKYKFAADSRELFMMNFTIAYLQDLPHANLVEDREAAHEAALLEDPFMTKAIGYLAVSAEHYGKTFSEPDHFGKETFTAFLEIHRASRAFKKAQQNIYDAYRASASIS